MKKIAALCVSALLVSGAAGGQERNPTPERVTVTFAGGGFVPVGDFGDRVKGGPSAFAGGFYRLNDYLSPAFLFQYASLEPDLPRGSLDTRSLLGGVRVHLLPERYPIRPWLTLLGGWAHYTSYRKLDLEPVFARGHDDRDDAMMSWGGGVEWRLHPKLGFGVDVREDVSFSTGDERGEETLRALSIAGVILLHY